mgnify:FL=1
MIPEQHFSDSDLELKFFRIPEIAKFRIDEFRKMVGIFSITQKISLVIFKVTAKRSKIS